MIRAETFGHCSRPAQIFTTLVLALHRAAYFKRYVKCNLIIQGPNIYYILLTKTTAARNRIALSYHSVRGLYLLADIFAPTIGVYYFLFLFLSRQLTSALETQLSKESAKALHRRTWFGYSE